MPDVLLPDVRTVVMMQMLVALLFAGIFGIIWRLGDGNRPVGAWAIGHTLSVIGTGLWVTRGLLPPILSIVVANVMMHGATLLICWGIWLMAGYRVPRWAVPAILLVDGALFLYFTFQNPDYGMRSAISSGLFATTCFVTAAMLPFERRPWLRAASLSAAGVLSVLGLAHGTGLIFILSQSLQAAQAAEPQRGGLLLLFLIASVAGDICLLWVHMAQAQHSLRIEIDQRRQSEAALAAAKEAAEQAAHAKSRFLANMSHEIRTPMNAVIGLTSLLQQTSLNDRQTRHVRRIAGAAGMLLRLTDGVLNVARWEAGVESPDKVDFSLDSVLDEVIDIMTHATETKGLRFVVERHDGVPTAVTGDPSRLGQILINIAGNAVKFTQSGTVTLSVGIAPAMPGGLCFVIRDTGPGIDQRQLDEIFEPFHQAHHGTGNGHDGTGLGLAIARQAARAMGGDITVVSALGQGSRFTVTLPLPMAAEPVATTTVTIRLDGARILVVDDDEVNREVAREILEHAGAVVELAVDGRAAVARATGPGPALDAILMDVRMPDVDGLAATAAIRQRYSKAKLPVIAVTAHAFDDERQLCLTAGMNDFVTKPVAPDRLLGVLDRWFPRDGTITPAAPDLKGAGRGKRVSGITVSGDDAAVTDTLPALPGFDLAAALDRFCGNAAVVRQLLSGFTRRYADGAALFSRISAGMSDEEIKQYLHRLQGAAATLGADEIAERAAHVATLLPQRHSAGFATEVGALAQALTAAVVTIDLAEIETAAPPLPEALPVELDRSWLLGAVTP